MRSARWLLGLLLAAATPLDAEPLADVPACARALAPGSRVGWLSLRSVDRTGAERALEGRLHWKRDEQGLSKLLVELEGPLDVRGSSYLVVQRQSGQEMWVLLPGLAKARRIHPRTISGQLFGTDFGYEDLARLASITRGRVERLPDQDLAGRRVLRLRALPDPEELSAYSRIEYFLDRPTCLPLRIEFHGPDGGLRKLLTADLAGSTRARSAWIPGSVVIRDVASGTESRLEVSGFEDDADLSDRLFEKTYLERAR